MKARFTDEQIIQMIVEQETWQKGCNTHKTTFGVEEPDADRICIEIDDGQNGRVRPSKSNPRTLRELEEIWGSSQPFAPFSTIPQSVL